MERDVYSGRLKFNGEEDIHTLVAANNYAGSLIKSKRAREANALLRKVMPVARRSLGEDHGLTLTMRLVYTQTLDDLRESVATLEELDRTARRVLGAAHPTTTDIGQTLQKARALLRAREASSGSA